MLGNEHILGYVCAFVEGLIPVVPLLIDFLLIWLIKEKKWQVVGGFYWFRLFGSQLVKNNNK